MNNHPILSVDGKKSKFAGLSGFFYLHHDIIYYSSVSIAERR